LNMENFRKVLILRPRFLGDIILATGLASMIRAKVPGSEIWFLAETAYAQVLEHHHDLTGTIPFDSKKKNNLLYLWGFYRELRSRRFDVVLDLFGNPRTAQMSLLSGARLRVGYRMKGRSWVYNRIAEPSSPPLPSGRRKVTEAYLDQLRTLGLTGDSPYRTSLAVTEEEREYAQKILGRAGLKPGEKLVVLTPGASWPAKRWPLERFLELGHQLRAKGVRPLYLFGPKEADLVPSFEEGMGKDWILINQPSIRGLMAFIQAADALVANDSGPMHVGPAVGTPTLGIFGPGEPEIWFPYDKPHEIAYSEEPCGHCGLEKCEPMYCMDHLDVKTVLEKVLAMITAKKN